MQTTSDQHLSRILLPYPNGWNGEVKYRQACGPTSIELALFNLGLVPQILNQPFSVSSTILELGAMLPYHIISSFDDAGVIASIQSITSDQIHYLEKEIRAGRAPIIFTGIGFGHWLIVWGFDVNHFYCFDTSIFSKPDSDGLTKYKKKDLLKKWGTLPKTIGFLLNAAGLFSHKLKIRPFTVIEYSAKKER